MTILALITTLILLALSGLHFYWARGGKIGLDKAIPQVGGKPLFTPGPLATAVVAVLLLALAALPPLLRWPVSGLETWTEIEIWIGRLGWLAAAGFLLRAVGDFRYCGLFKKNRGTVFARLDTRYYTPLCLGLGTAMLLLTWMRP